MMYYRLINIPGASKTNVPACTGVSGLTSRANYVSQWYSTETEVFGITIKVAIPGNFSQLEWATPQLHANILIVSHNNPENDNDALIGGTAYEVTSARLGNSQIWIEASLWGVLTYQLTGWSNLSTDSILITRRLPTSDLTLSFESLPVRPNVSMFTYYEPVDLTEDRFVVVTLNASIIGEGTSSNPYTILKALPDDPSGTQCVLFKVTNWNKSTPTYMHILSALQAVADDKGTEFTDYVKRIQLLPKYASLTVKGFVDFKYGGYTIRQQVITTVNRVPLYSYNPPSLGLYPAAYNSSATITVTAFGVELATYSGASPTQFNVFGSLVGCVNLFLEVLASGQPPTYTAIPTWECMTVGDAYTQWVNDNKSAFTNQLTSNAISIVGSALTAAAGIATGGIGLVAGIAATAALGSTLQSRKSITSQYEASRNDAKRLMTNAGQISGYTGMYSYLAPIRFDVCSIAITNVVSFDRVVSEYGVPAYGVLSLRTYRAYDRFDVISGNATVEWGITPFSPAFASIADCKSAFVEEVYNGFNIWYKGPIGDYSANPIYGST